MKNISKIIDSLTRFVKQVDQCSHGKLAWALVLLIAVPTSFLVSVFIWQAF